MMSYCIVYFFFFKQKTAYEMRISDWFRRVLFRSPLFCRLSAGPARLWPSTPCGVRPRVPLGDGSSRSLLLAPSGMSPEQPKEKVQDRKSVVQGQRVSVRVAHGGPSIIKKKKTIIHA